jgi:hypothetical protein
MSMLAPFAPALIKGGIGLGASLIGGKLAGGTPKGDQSILDANNQAMKDNLAMSGQLRQGGSDLVNLAGRSFNPVVDYYSRILSGGRSGLMSALGPQASNIGMGYQNARNTIASLTPRGGGRSTMMADLPFQQQKDVTSLFQTERAGAPAGLLQAGSQASNAGNNLISNAIQSMYGATSAGRTVLDYNAQKRAADREFGGKLAAPIYDLLKGLNIGKLGGGSKGSGTATGGVLGEFP